MLQSCPTLRDPWTVACQAPLSMGFSRQEYWSGLPCPPPEDLPASGIEPASLTSPVLAGEFFATSTNWEAPNQLYFNLKRKLMDSRERSTYSGLLYNSVSSLCLHTRNFWKALNNFMHESHPQDLLCGLTGCVAGTFRVSSCLPIHSCSVIYSFISQMCFQHLPFSILVLEIKTVKLPKLYTPLQLLSASRG